MSCCGVGHGADLRHNSRVMKLNRNGGGDKVKSDAGLAEQNRGCAGLCIIPLMDPLLSPY